ncbi:MAG: MMPL family transporter [Deltaproteobacteria bacterium]|nr:MAG: MMPL family transporter [Deltaproteobacteria bacterium]
MGVDHRLRFSFFILLFYFKRLESTCLIGIPLTVSLIWTGGLVYFFLGHLNMMTGFGAAILGGLGSDYGIYLLTRYYHERSLGHGVKAACEQAFGSTGKATYGSMLTMVAGLVALVFSKFGVFVEFGIVGALGLVTTYVGMMLIVPALLTISEKWKYPVSWKGFGKIFPNTDAWTTSATFQKIFYPRKAFLGVILIFIICAISVFTLPVQSKIFFEEGQMESPDLPGNKLGRRVNQVMKHTVDPTVLIAHGADEEEKIVTLLDERLKNNASNLVYDRVLGLSSFIPQEQIQKKKLLARILNKLTQTTLILKSEKDYLSETLKDSLAAPVVLRKDIPYEVRRLFEAIHQKDIYAVFLFPAFSRADSESMKRYQDGVYALKKELGLLDMEVADGTFIASDTVRLIEREAPRGMFLILTFFTIVLFVMVKSWTRGLMILSNLLGSLFLLSGLLWLAGIRLNIMNIAVIPVVLGGGIDIYIHFSHRFDERIPMREILKGEVPAMFISSLTSMVGFGGFLLVSSSGLRSIGWVSVLGLGLVTLMAVFGFPRFLLLGARWKNK